MFALAALLLTLVYICYYTVTRKYDYWKKKKVPYLPPTFLLGNYGSYILQQESIQDSVEKIIKKCPNEPMIGAYYGTEPVLIVKDVELIKLILSKDFYFFNARELTKHIHKEPVSERNMFFAYGDQWKVLRQNITPLFAPAKLKNMFHIIEQYARIFENVLDETHKKSPELEIRGILACFTMDCICACVFGIDPKVMESSQSDNNIYRHMADVIFDVSPSRGAMTVLRAVWPGIFYGLGFHLFPKSVYNFFKSEILSVFFSRNNEPGPRQDFVDMLLNLKNNKVITGDSLRNPKMQAKEKVSLKVTDELLVAQSILMFSAGFDTSATTLANTLYELAKHPEAQDKVIAEVDSYLEKRGQLEFDCLTELPYLEQCFDEALRLYPVLTNLTREVYEDYTLPNGVKLEKGLRIHLPTYHVQHDPKYFKDPDAFRPERFSPEEKKNIVPYSYFPFGEGPRICLGMRFAKMQMMAGCVTLLKKYRVELAPGMPSKVRFEPRAFVIQSDIGLNLTLKPREGWEQRVYK